ncbi:ABC transporter ATP-binding protein [Aliarcobacter butzleri]|uniref:ABC transporter ATP-binding protein n=1 Tax=Aliarcobacter butzleri TaxID=28197 RepID=UPI003B227A21
MKENSASYSKAIINEAQSFTFMIIAFLQMVSEFFVVFFIYAFLLYVNFEATLYISMVMTILVLIIMKPISKKIKNVGIEREIGQKQVYESLHSTFGNYKILKLHESKKFNINNFEQSIKKLVNSNIIFQTISPIPKLLLEFLGFSVILIVISFYVYSQERNIQNILPLVSVYVLAMYRLLPSVSRIVTGYNSLLFAHKSFEIISEHLLYKIEKLGTDKINFENNISINKGFFYYENKEKIVINNISLNIKKGDSIAFIGSSGSGKSTLVDIIMGLQILNSGSLNIDDVEINKKNIQSYRSKIGYIPQQVYLFDGTVKDNIIFGEEYDAEKLISVLKQAQLYDFLLQKDGVNTLVGESGNLLSGGQKQRVAIARALYTNPDILVLDEATSALDNDTEAKIMDEIYQISKDKTLIIIAHRLSTIEKCDRVYKIKNGKLENVR